MKCNIKECNIYELLKTLSSKYLAFILIELYQNNLQYNQIGEKFEYLTNTQLTRCLNKCLKEELVEKKKSMYSLTEYGQNVTKHLIELEELYSQ